VPWKRRIPGNPNVVYCLSRGQGRAQRPERHRLRHMSHPGRLASDEIRIDLIGRVRRNHRWTRICALSKFGRRRTLKTLNLPDFRAIRVKKHRHHPLLLAKRFRRIVWTTLRSWKAMVIMQKKFLLSLFSGVIRGRFFRHKNAICVK